MKGRKYIAIDLKSFYASVECIDRGLDPLKTNLVVADPERTEKTIGLAVSPSLKSFGIPSRPRLFEVIARVKEINRARERDVGGRLTGESYNYTELSKNKNLAIGYITAPPRMARYIEVSAEIYKVYLKYVSPDDIHVYSIDEVFIDATGYLSSYKMTAEELCRKMIGDVFKTTGVTATAGIGTNLYLAKVAMDILAKKMPPDKFGARIASLDVTDYRKKLWNHTPITDFWRVGKGYSKKLQAIGLYTMGDIARCSIVSGEKYPNENTLYKLFGVNAELLIDHAWGEESCEMEDIKSYKPDSSSLGSGQVLHCAYTSEKARLVLLEMADQLALDLFEKGLRTDSLALNIGYDAENLLQSTSRDAVKDIVSDYYGRSVPKPSHGTYNLQNFTSSSKEISEGFMRLFDEIANKDLLIRRISITACHVLSVEELKNTAKPKQLDIFSLDDEKDSASNKADDKEKEKRIQSALVDIKSKFGKNAIVKAMSLEEGATGIERNKQIGGHKA